jgi:1-acyl-sn-glycerol-3-phosphate acyltransferase
LREGSEQVLYEPIRLLVAALTRIIVRPVIEGTEHLPSTGPVIVASNHLSFVDSVVIPLAAPRRVAFLTKAEYFTRRGPRGWATRSFFGMLGSVPVERGAHRAATAALQDALAVLLDGKALGIYPEGTRSADGRLYRGRTGVAWLALTSGAPVVPVAVGGTDKIMPVGATWPRLRRFAVRFGEPLDFTGRAAAAGQSPARLRREITDEIMRAIAGLSGQHAAGVYNDFRSKAS